jgi:quercetin dioxygenase-like cupin family protein
MTQSHQPGQDVFRAILSEDVQWKVFPGFPPAARLAVLVGDPTAAGPYLTRVHLPAGTKMLPHKHPEDRIYTVMSGVFYIGLGDHFDAEKLTAYGPGSVVVLPGGQAHFHWAKSGDYITQISAIGPLGLDYVRAGDDPRNS